MKNLQEAIHPREDSFSDRWIKYREEKGKLTLTMSRALKCFQHV